MALSKLKASLASVTNELTLTAANLNLDFSLFKFEAPVTYQPFGNALSRSRRNEAEHGSIHSTARKLGQLFLHALPGTPRLEEAYGTRVCEILAQTETMNTKKGWDKLFHGQLGADGTTIWAAATSGPGALPVHLLACMLARIWPVSRAVSIWVEIVAERRKEIAAAFDQENNMDYPTLNAAQHDISRDSLAEWDASARAWLGAADGVLQNKIDHLRVVIAELNLPIAETTDPYPSVMKAWKTAMSTMENLLTGQPQTVYNGAALLGLSAWHIFPDLIVFGESDEEVINKDPLVGAGGVLTVGLQYKSQSTEDGSGVHWSLSLAHLKYYGPPVKASSNLEHENLRVPFDQFTCTALGALTPILGCTIPEAASWFTACVEQISAYSDDATVLFRKPSKETRSQVNEYLTDHGAWFTMFAAAGTVMLEGDSTEKRTAAMLANCGQRNGQQFYCRSADEFGHLFGICHPEILMQLLPSSNLRVELLRTMVERLYPAGNGSELLIRYRSKQSSRDASADSSSRVVWEFATTAPEVQQATATISGSSQRLCHKRWAQLDVSEPRQICSCLSMCGSCQCRTSWTSSCHNPDNHPEPGSKRMLIDQQLQSWRTSIEELGETTEITLDPWTAFQMRRGSAFSESDTEFLFSRERGKPPLRYRFVAGDPQLAAIYIPQHLHRDRSWANRNTPAASKAPPANAYLHTIKIQDITRLVNMNGISAYHLIAILRQLDDAAIGQQTRKGETSRQLFTNLRALTQASRVYKMLPSATVAIKSISLPLHASLWIPRSSSNSGLERTALSRSQTFSCVAMFESGYMNVNPDLLSRVFAMSSLDSIFVSSTLLCDPIEQPQPFELQRVLGNVGRAGMAMLIPPETPDIKRDSWSMVEHLDFDGITTDSFGQTSLHLDFSGYKLPLMVTAHGLVDVEVYLLEAIVRVRDKGNWIADLDVIKVLQDEQSKVYRHQAQSNCTHGSLSRAATWATSIDSWQELLEPPNQTGIVRASGNSLARLALTCVAVNQGHQVHVLPLSACWLCEMPRADFDTKNDGKLPAEHESAIFGQYMGWKRPASPEVPSQPMSTDEAITKKRKLATQFNQADSGNVDCSGSHNHERSAINQDDLSDQDDKIPLPSMLLSESDREIKQTSAKVRIFIL